MQITFLKGYPDYVGKRFIWAGFGNGPASYANTGTNATSGDVIVFPRFQNYIDLVLGDFSVSGTYYVHAQQATVGARPAWRLRWYVAATNAEVANLVNLSAEQIQIGGFGGVY
jgi:hypothetical protein